MGGPRREQDKLIGELDGLTGVVGDEKSRRGPFRPHLQQQAPQAVGRLFVE
ncbi:MAG: hypothetical protein ACTSSR_00450 [Alphaproteobacteria bacterium]